MSDSIMNRDELPMAPNMARLEQPKTEWPLSALLVGLGCFLLVLWLSSLVVARENAASLSDNVWYIKMSQGDYAVPKPFNTRIVVPWLAGTMSSFTGIGIQAAFLVVQSLAFMTLHLFAALTMRRLFGLGILLSATATGICLCTQGFVWLVGALYYPDLMFLAWTAMAIWAFLTERWWLVALALFLALITRDSSALPLALVVFVGSFLQRRKAGMLAPVLAIAGQQIFFKLVYAPGVGNVHGLGEVLYLPLKLVVNSSRSYLGLRMWSNTLGDNAITGPSNPAPPTTWSLPEWLHVGGIREVGVYPWSFSTIVDTYVQMGVSFGLPLVVALVLARKLVSKSTRASTVASLRLPGCLLLAYGLLMLLLGPATGTDVPRLIMAAWPCMVIIGAGWLTKTQMERPLVACLLLLLSSVTGWIFHFAWRHGPDLLWLHPLPLAGCVYLGAFAAVVWLAGSRWRAVI